MRYVPFATVRRPFAALLLVFAACAATAAVAEAQRIPGVPGTGGQRPGGAGEPRPALQPRTDAADDTTGRRAVEPDSLFERLRALDGFVVVEYMGDSAEFMAQQRVLRLHGNPDVTRDGTRLTARDSIIYRERSEFVEVYGSPRVEGEGQDIAGDVMFYHLGSRRARVLGARTTITDGATWYVTGNVTSEEGERIYASDGIFTSDDRDLPAYHFRAERIKIIRNRVLVGRPAVLYFRNVPVMALPFIVQDLERGRRSGFLVPRFELNDIVRTNAARGDRGTGRQISNVGYYFALSDYLGATLAGEWRSESWRALNADLQFRSRQRFLSGNASLTNYWRAEGTRNTNVRANANWEPDERTTLAANVDWRQDAGFERDRSLNPFFQTSEVSSTASLRRRMGFGDVAATGERRQSIGTGDLTLRPNVSLNLNPITLFPAGPDGGAWYSDATLTINGSGSMTQFTPGDEAIVRRVRSREDANASASMALRLGQINLRTGSTYTRSVQGALAGVDSALLGPNQPISHTENLPRTGGERLEFSGGTGYQINLFGATRVTPSISFGQSLVRTEMPDSLRMNPPGEGDPAHLAYGRWVAGVPRPTLSAPISTEFFGFFPGFGEYSAVRHHVTPSINYEYRPRVSQDTIQALAFGRNEAREVNQVRIGLNQTFEAKLRPRRPAQPDAAGPAGDAPAAGAVAGTDGVPAGQPGAPAGGGTATAAATVEEARKITLLAINTSAVAYSFVPIDEFGTRMETDVITNSFRSDLFGGFSFDMGHSLWEYEPGTGPGGRVRTRFSPFMTSASTSFRLDANSSIFRWLGFQGGGREVAVPAAAAANPDLQSGVDEMGRQEPDRRGNTAFDDAPRVGGADGGPWSAAFSYSLARQRPFAGDGFPQRGADQNNQRLTASINFVPTRNWAVGWNTGYSITTGEFDTHILNLRRDLYRWQANFNFIRAPNGNTAFSFEVHLTDLPDLKADWREQNLGGRRQ